MNSTNQREHNTVFAVLTIFVTLGCLSAIFSMVELVITGLIIIGALTAVSVAIYARVTASLDAAPAPVHIQAPEP